MSIRKKIQVPDRSVDAQLVSVIRDAASRSEKRDHRDPMGGVLELGKLCGQINRGSGGGIWQPQVRLIFTLAILNKNVCHRLVFLLSRYAIQIHGRQPGAGRVTSVLDRESLTLVFHQRDRGS